MTFRTHGIASIATSDLSRRGPMLRTLNFAEVLSGTQSGAQSSSSRPDWFGGGLHQQLLKASERLTRGERLTTQELLLTQIRAQALGVQVELLSKAAESGLSVVKRLQQPS